VISGVLAGINELSADDAVLEKLENTRIIPDTKYCINCGFKMSKQQYFALHVVQNKDKDYSFT